MLNSLEKSLGSLYKNLPSISPNGQKGLVRAWPWIALVFGLLQLFAAWNLWHVGHLVNNLVTTVNQYANLYGITPAVHSLGLFYYLSLIVLALDGVILLLAYPGLRARSKRGWNMLFLAAVVNIVYGLVSVFDSSYGGVGKLVSTVFGSAIAFYFLFQVRSYYLSPKTQKTE
ncbi:MAG TPA: hypothetical protein VNE40_00350 [Candidatus Dormibacteraeota bacterium]|nr:hypothetical protein [Candidatus Dormibacteraeota bacterium]